MARKAKPEISNDPPPPGAKQVTQTTTVRFQEPIHGDGELCSDCDRPESAADHTDKNHPNYHKFVIRGEEIDDETDGFELEEEPKTSPLDSLLSSLKGVGEITVYIIRKPDPIGLSFREPCNMAHTAGDLPFDESFTSKEAIELAVQSVYGGGKFQLQIRQNGDYVTAWTTLIADPRKRETQQQPASVTATQEPARTAREELREALELAKDIIGIRGRSNPEQPALPPKPDDPFERVNETLDTFEKMRDLVNANAPVGGDRNWVDSATNLVDRVTNSKLALLLGDKFSTALLNYIATAGVGVPGPRPPAAESPGGSATQQQPALPPGPPTPPAASAPGDQEAAPPFAVPEISAEEIPGALAAFDVVVRALRAYDLTEESEEEESHVSAAADALMKLSAGLLQWMLGTPAAVLLVQLSQLNPEWAVVAEITHATAFISALKTEVKSRLEGKGISDVVDLNEVKDARERREGKSQ